MRRHRRECIEALIKLSLNLTTTYTLLPPSSYLIEMERIRPATNPERSPIPQIRRRWALDHMDIGDLRKLVWNGEKGVAEEEKEWLINHVMGREGLVEGADAETNDVKGMGDEVTKKRNAYVLIDDDDGSDLDILTENSDDGVGGARMMRRRQKRTL